MRWFSAGTPVSSTNKADGHDIAEILLKVALRIITLPHYVSRLYHTLVARKPKSLNRIAKIH
jgi:hypothetical protein